MYKSLILMAVLAAPAAAVAQNDSTPAVGRMTGWEDAPEKPRAVTFTTLGTYRDDGEQRLIDVTADADADGDGATDRGVLSVSCNGGDILSGVFNPRAAAAGKSRGAAGSTLAGGTQVKASWEKAGAVAAVTIGPDQPDICAGMG